MDLRINRTSQPRKEGEGAMDNYIPLVEGCCLHITYENPDPTESM